MSEKTDLNEMKTIPDFYGENVFSLKVMRNYLSEAAYKTLSTTIRTGDTLDPNIADEVADAMKTWAVSKGATHFTHWFQPLTGTTAEKQKKLCLICASLLMRLKGLFRQINGRYRLMLKCCLCCRIEPFLAPACAGAK